jgi:hypothetical protein
MEPEKNRWIDQVISSSSKMKSLQAPGHLQQRILDTLEGGQVAAEKIAYSQFTRIVVAASIMLVLNLGVLLYSSVRVAQPASSVYSIDTYNLAFY